MDTLLLVIAHGNSLNLLTNDHTEIQHKVKCCQMAIGIAALADEKNITLE
jgi:hypothetical protein